MTFGSDYGIWEPKWQVEGFVDWDYPSDEFSDFPRVNTATKKKILGLNAAKLYDIEVPAEFQLRLTQAGTPAAQDDAQLVDEGMTAPVTRAALCRVQGATAAAPDQAAATSAGGPVLAALETVRDPELDEPITSLGFVASCTVSGGRGRAGQAAAAHLLLRAQLRLPDGRRRLRRGVARCRACAAPRWCWRSTLPRTRSTAAWPRRPGFAAVVRRRGGRRAARAARRLPAQGGDGRHRPGVLGRCSAAGARAGRRCSR